MKRGIGAIATGFVLLVPPAFAATPAQLRALIEQGNSEEAYRQARASPEQLGEPAFDFVLGVAAINVGKATEGVLALERFLLHFPDNDAARLELARGYFNLAEDARAKEEFEAVRSRRPAAPVAALIDEYLAAIRVREAKYSPTAMAFLVLGAGYDSNPRAGVDNPEITLPVFGQVTVADAGLAVGSQTWESGAGFRVTAPAGTATTAFAQATADVRRYPDDPSVDQVVYAGSAGFAQRRGAWGGRVAASAGSQKLDGEMYRRVHGLALDGSWIPDERNAVSAGLQVGKFGYFGNNAVRDSDFLTAAAGWRRFFPGAWRPDLEASANMGREKNRYDNHQDLSRDMRGARLAASVSPWRGWTLGANAVWLRSDYHEPDPTLLTTREDRYLAGELTVEWRWADGLALRAEFLGARNQSNLDLYEYRRHAALLRVRYETR
jgi:hypothetical protein